MQTSLHAIVLSSLLFIALGSAQAQCPGCVPDLSCVSDPAFPTLCPLSPPDATAGVAYGTDITFWLPAVFTDPGTGFTVDFEQMTVTGVSGLPFGLDLETNAPGSVYYPQENQYGCARLCGTPLIAGTYAITISILAGVNFNGFDVSVPQEFSILLNVLPGAGGNASFAYSPTAGCGSVTANFEALIDGAPSPTTYTWDLGNGSTSTASVPPPQTYEQPGTYVITLETTLGGYVLNTVTLTGTNGNWCGDVEEPDVPFVGCTGNPDPYFVLTDASGGTFTSGSLDNTQSGTWNDLGLLLDEPPYSITFFDEDVVSQDDALGTYNIPANGAGTYFINVAGGTTGSLAVSNDPQQVFTDSDTVTVYGLPEIAVLNDEGSGELCATPDTLVYYTWFHDGDTVPGSNVPCLTPTGPGLWWVAGINAQGCTALSDTITICPEVTISQNGNVLFVSSGYASYAWTYQGAAIGGNDAFVFTNGDGLYTVTVTDINGCVVVNDYLLSTLGVSAPSGTSVNLGLYPNPTAGAFTVVADGLGDGPVLLEVVDISGRVVHQRRESPGSGRLQVVLDLSLPPGSYVLQLQDGTGQRMARVVVE